MEIGTMPHKNVFLLYIRLKPNIYGFIIIVVNTYIKIQL